MSSDSELSDLGSDSDTQAEQQLHLKSTSYAAGASETRKLTRQSLRPSPLVGTSSKTVKRETGESETGESELENGSSEEDEDEQGEEDSEDVDGDGDDDEDAQSQDEASDDSNSSSDPSDDEWRQGDPIPTLTYKRTRRKASSPPFRPCLITPSPTPAPEELVCPQ